MTSSIETKKTDRYTKERKGERLMMVEMGANEHICKMCRSLHTVCA